MQAPDTQTPTEATPVVTVVTQQPSSKSLQQIQESNTPKPEEQTVTRTRRGRALVYS